MAKLNNGFWKILVALVGVAGMLISIGIVYATLSGGVDHNCEKIKVMEPEVKLNSQYRLKDEVDSLYIKEKIQKIELSQQRFDRRQQEQTALLNEINRKLEQ